MFARAPAAAGARPITLDALRLGERIAHDAGDDDADDGRPEAEPLEKREPEGADSEPHSQDDHGQRRHLRRPLVVTALAHAPSITPRQSAGSRRRRRSDRGLARLPEATPLDPEPQAVGSTRSKRWT